MIYLRHHKKYRSFNKRIFVKLTALLTAIVLFSVTAAGCGASGTSPAEDVPMRTFTDSVGREVEVPQEITKVAVSGSLAQMYVFALCPDKMCGTANGWSDEALKYIDPKYQDLPSLGTLYGSKGDLNVETIMSTGAQVIIDVGETKESIEQDLDDLQEQVGIPAVHISAYLDNTGEAFRMLGDLVGMPEEAEKLAKYCEDSYEKARETAAKVDKKEILYLDGDLGQGVMTKGSYHAEIIDLLCENLADADTAGGKGSANEVDMEQLFKWDPEYIIFAPQSYYKYAPEEKEWLNLQAIRNDKFYEVPYGPYNWMGKPPSCQRYLGILWLIKLLYPEEADYDLYEKTKEFYSMFVHTDLTRQQYEDLTAESIMKAEAQQ